MRLSAKKGPEAALVPLGAEAPGSNLAACSPLDAWIEQNERGIAAVDEKDLLERRGPDFVNVTGTIGIGTFVPGLAVLVSGEPRDFSIMAGLATLAVSAVMGVAVGLFSRFPYKRAQPRLEGWQRAKPELAAGFAQLAKNDSASARASFASAQQHSPATARQAVPQLHVILATLAERCGDLPDAERWLTSSLAETGASEEARYPQLFAARARVRAQRGDTEGALQDVSAFRRLDPEDKSGCRSTVSAILKWLGEELKAPLLLAAPSMESLLSLPASLASEQPAVDKL